MLMVTVILIIPICYDIRILNIQADVSSYLI